MKHVMIDNTIRCVGVRVIHPHSGTHLWNFHFGQTSPNCKIQNILRTFCANSHLQWRGCVRNLMAAHQTQLTTVRKWRKVVRRQEWWTKIRQLSSVQLLITKREAGRVTPPPPISLCYFQLRLINEKKTSQVTSHSRSSHLTKKMKFWWLSPCLIVYVLTSTNHLRILRSSFTSNNVLLWVTTVVAAM